MDFQKRLILIRGLPGAGKTTLVEHLVNIIDSISLNADIITNEDLVFSICADDCWDIPYTKETFNSVDLYKAHCRCKNLVEQYMDRDFGTIFVHNTFTTEKEMEPYFELADKYGYQVITLIVENRHGCKSVHEVPDKTMEKMKNRFSIKL